mmetsp:Transcript_54608/g.175134  ORF Transcript_54608/g.175134 Transcript_54608/m.175134 type:complete len:286 (-) Transcript_54608:83-940(-)
MPLTRVRMPAGHAAAAPFSMRVRCLPAKCARRLAHRQLALRRTVPRPRLAPVTSGVKASRGRQWRRRLRPPGPSAKCPRWHPRGRTCTRPGSSPRTAGTAPPSSSWAIRRPAAARQPRLRSPQPLRGRRGQLRDGTHRQLAPGVQSPAGQRPPCPHSGARGRSPSALRLSRPARRRPRTSSTSCRTRGCAPAQHAGLHSAAARAAADAAKVMTATGGGDGASAPAGASKHVSDGPGSSAWTPPDASAEVPPALQCRVGAITPTRSGEILRPREGRSFVQLDAHRR